MGAAFAAPVGLRGAFGALAGLRGTFGAPVGLREAFGAPVGLRGAFAAPAGSRGASEVKGALRPTGAGRRGGGDDQGMQASNKYTGSELQRGRAQ